MGIISLAKPDDVEVDAIPRPYDPFDYGIHADPYPTYAWMRENAPLYRNEERDFWAVSRYADVKDVLRNAQLFSNRNGISLEPELWGPHAVKTSLFLAMDPPEHGAHRGLVGSQFTPKRVGGLEERIRKLAQDRLEPLRDLERFDFAADYAAAVPNDVLCEYLGVPAEDWDQVRADTDQLNQREDGSTDRGASSVAAALRLADYFLDLVKHLRKYPKDNVTMRMIESDANGVKHSDSDIVAFLFLMVSAGNESTGKTIGNAWYQGWVFPEVQRQGLDGRAEDWIQETLRFDSASQMTARMVTERTVLHGVELEEGSRVAVLPASANRDDEVFPHADRFDLDRDTSNLISFGRGPHHCLGSALANLEMRIAIEEISTIVQSYEIDIANARRVHSPHQRGFAALPCTVRHR